VPSLVLASPVAVWGAIEACDPGLGAERQRVFGRVQGALSLVEEQGAVGAGPFGVPDRRGRAAVRVVAGPVPQVAVHLGGMLAEPGEVAARRLVTVVLSGRRPPTREHDGAASWGAGFSPSG
jgi:hypothetical protein